MWAAPHTGDSVFLFGFEVLPRLAKWLVFSSMKLDVFTRLL